MHKALVDEGSHFMLAFRFNKANLEPFDGSFTPFRAKPHKLSTLRLNTWLCALREISFVVAATISSLFKWHQTGCTLFQAYKWPSAGAPSDSSTKPDRWQAKDGILQMIHNVVLFPIQMACLINFIKARRI